MNEVVNIFCKDVLILIFLENALRQCIANVTGYKKSLNPYFFGKCSTASVELVNKKSANGLNPYFFGKCSTA